MQNISLIVAVSENNQIGGDNQLLWSLPNDLKHFKAMTFGKPVIMGRKTFESIGKPLPGRQNIILTQQKALVIPGCDVVHSVSEALAIALNPNVMIIGGGEIYRLFFPQVDTMYITHVHAQIPGEVSFIDFNKSDWQETSRERFSQDERHAFDYSFVTYQRKR